MAYQNIPVASGYQVVQQIASFAATVGWTVHRSEPRPADTTYYVTTISNGLGAYLTLIGNNSEIFLNGHRGLDVGLDWDQQPDQYVNDATTQTTDATRCQCRLRVTPITSVFMFGGGGANPYLYCAIEVEPGYYRHICMTYLKKFGTSLGGLAYDISESANYGAYVSYSQYVHTPFVYNSIGSYGDNNRGGFDAQDAAGLPAWVTFGGGPDARPSGGHWGDEVYTFMVASPIRFNSRTPLMVPLISVSSGVISLTGYP